MKNTLNLITILACSIFSMSSPAAAVVVYSEEADVQMHVAATVNATNELTRTGSARAFPAAFSGHRSVCTVASTNAPYVAWAGASSYAIGNPYGCSTGRDYNAIELTDRSEITPRFNLLAQKADRELTVENVYTNILEYVYSKGLSQTALSNALGRQSWMKENRIEAPSAQVGDTVRVRIVRWLVDRMPIWRVGVNARVLVDKFSKMDGSSFLTESDIISDDEPDIDWKYLWDEVVTNQGVLDEGLNVECMYYLVVFGDGPVSWNGASDSNTVVRALPIVIKRDFGSSAPTARAIAFTSPAPLARPTFRFATGGQDSRTATAFDLKIMSGSTVAWSNGVMRIPPRDLDGNYVYPAPSLTGTLSAGTYTWQVRLLNSKYKNSAWSSPSNITLE